jgi:hypothetical protein
MPVAKRKYFIGHQNHARPELRFQAHAETCTFLCRSLCLNINTKSYGFGATEARRWAAKVLDTTLRADIQPLLTERANARPEAILTEY